MTRYQPFTPRVISAAPAVRANGYVVKQYQVVREREAFDEARFAPGLATAYRSLPPVDAGAGRPGAAFLIAHQGLTGDYLVLAWWDRENELPARVWVRDVRGWRAAERSESFCVWDLEIMWFERNAWIATALAGAPVEAALDAYTEMTMPAAQRRLAT